MTQLQYEKTMLQINRIMAKGESALTNTELNRLKRLALECEKYEKKTFFNKTKNHEPKESQSPKKGS